MGDIEVEPATWKTTASIVDDAASAVDAAQYAGNNALPPDAFGLMCSPLLLPPYLAVAGLAGSVMGSIATGLRQTATNLISVGNMFHETDEEIADSINRLAPSLGGL